MNVIHPSLSGEQREECEVDSRFRRRLDCCTLEAYDSVMNIISIRHKGLKRLIEADDDRGIRPTISKRVRNILTALISASNMNGVKGYPGWRIHQLKGDRISVWSISVSGNFRITFKVIDEDIYDLNLEDYH